MSGLRQPSHRRYHHLVYYTIFFKTVLMFVCYKVSVAEFPVKSIYKYIYFFNRLYKNLYLLYTYFYVYYLNNITIINVIHYIR